jgi:hypothetical protein
MTSLDDKLRAALRETADEIPPYAPPLRLSPRRRGWIAWAAPLASATLVVALIAASLAIAAAIQRPKAASSQTGLGGVPPYYVAIVTGKGQPDEDDSYGPAAEVRATATGAVLARIVPPKPYADFTGVTAAADDRTFVLSAQEKFQPPSSVQQEARDYPLGYTPAARFFLLHIDPASHIRTTLQALPARFIPTKDAVHDMALSPDGTLLAADVGGQLFDSQLFVFNLATETERAWSFKSCSHCLPSSGGLGTGGVNADALSWTAGGQLAFMGPGASGQGPGAVRLLDVNALGTNLETDSRPVVNWPGGPNDGGPDWRGGIVTPDGRTAVIIEELVTRGVREQLAEFSTATGRATAILNNLPVVGLYEQVLYTNASGSELVVSYARPGMSAGIVRGKSYTPIPWNPQICTAAW